ncbi:hypothetical protein HIM_11406 [Hirsutella minnesotensis 3608]|uniref:Uncharacterized protein n=1 Tax=Hirsutella minnesotensis 3608 TaxID=1043627 RepID=A0A0F7ZFI6_9HYPO|nr:hypothetical protein HIM_11406 [Hirsutella minnesotensis 3608]
MNEADDQWKLIEPVPDEGWMIQRWDSWEGKDRVPPEAKVQQVDERTLAVSNDSAGGTKTFGTDEILNEVAEDGKAEERSDCTGREERAGKVSKQKKLRSKQISQFRPKRAEASKAKRRIGVCLQEEKGSLKMMSGSTKPGTARDRCN